MKANLERLKADALRGYKEKGFLPNRYRFIAADLSGNVRCCGIGSACVLTLNDLTLSEWDISQWATKHYGLSDQAIRGFMHGFDSAMPPPPLAGTGYTQDFYLGFEAGQNCYRQATALPSVSEKGAVS